MLAHANRLMHLPIVLTMGEKDALIPVVETRKVTAVLRANPHFVYHATPNGDHDSALWVNVDFKTPALHCAS